MIVADLPSPAAREELQSCILDDIRRFYGREFNLNPNEPLTVSALASTLDNLQLSSAMDPHKVAQDLLCKHWSVSPSPNPISFASFAAAMLQVSPYPSGSSIVDAVLAEVRSTHRGLNHPYLKLLPTNELPNPHGALFHVLRNCSIATSSLLPVAEAVQSKLKTSLHVKQVDEALRTANTASQDQSISSLKKLKQLFPGSVAPSHDINPGAQFRDTIVAFVRADDTSESAALGALSVVSQSLSKLLDSFIIDAIRVHASEADVQGYCSSHNSSDVYRAAEDVFLSIARDVVCRHPQAPREFVYGVLTVLEALEKMWDALLQHARNMARAEVRDAERSVANGAAPEEHLNHFSSEGLEDIRDLLHQVKGKSVLHVGCGDGSLARMLRENGAASVFGVDMCQELIDRAIAEENSDPLGGLSYAVGDGVRVVDVVRRAGPSRVRGLLLETDLDDLFDVAVATLPSDQCNGAGIQRMMQNVFRLLRPGGTFLFAAQHLRKSQCMKTSSDAKQGEALKSWEKCVKMDGSSGMLETFTAVGFCESPEVFELRGGYKPTKMKESNSARSGGDLFRLAFVARKPIEAQSTKRSPEITWPRTNSMSTGDLQLHFPAGCSEQLFRGARKLLSNGLVPDTVCPADVNDLAMPDVWSYAAEARRRICTSTGPGVVLIPNFFPSDSTSAPNIEVKKMAYFLLSSCIGKVSKIRGALWDVKDRGLDRDDNNVVVSTTSAAAPFHSDGIGRDSFPDIIGLMCLEPAPEGGELGLANVCNIFHALKARLPGEVFAELQRDSVIFDLVDGGLGDPPRTLKDCTDVKQVAQRIRELVMQGQSMLPLRLRDNTFPIFSRDNCTGEMRFRYIRYWVEHGHHKAGVPLSPELVEAMDALDEELGDGEIMYALKMGEVIFVNNHCFAHMRTAFTKGSGRHMVRAWLDAEF